ncbi:unnamed protein product [Didymodactylos carnosus]|uniref:NEDD8-activating enzyme E1 catalytic subunit n=1 Tax=Didymodactylos carnosus TaxID=1234261 RepID=A0A813X6Z3_9BILA|nr:unnamed protein product [Didymodactylos carnosus]CAF3654790.1 unnamed protein product [Didymodactylos carnosus]
MTVPTVETRSANNCNETNSPKRWSHIRRVLERPGPFSDPAFEPSTEILPFLESMKILIIGAGGLGCELLKDLALMGFRQISIIDMDTIDLANLNRQFLFKFKDIGKPKAEVAAKFIMNRIPACKVTLLTYDDETNQVDPSTIIPLVDGGTEGFKGNARVIYPGITACIECNLDLFPPQVAYPMCTLANQPRLPEHCVEWVTVLHWKEHNPFGKDVRIDGDSVQHIQWIYERALERAKTYKITGITFRFTQGVVKRIIPAVASTNAIVASISATEVFKLATRSVILMNNYTIFNDIEGIYTYTFEAEKKSNCPVCSTIPQKIELNETSKLQEVLDTLIERYNLISPGITTADNEGQNRTLYMISTQQFEEITKPNLNKTLQELNLTDGTELTVVDKTRANPMRIFLHITSSMETTSKDLIYT